MGLTISTDKKGVMIFANAHETDHGTFYTYNMGVSSKDKDGKYVNGYVPCRFKKGVSVPNKAKIQINNGFYVVNEVNDKKYVSVMITDFESLDGNEEWVKVDESLDSELPFAD